MSQKFEVQDGNGGETRCNEHHHEEYSKFLIQLLGFKEHLFTNECKELVSLS